MMKKKHTDFPILLAECKFAKISCPLDWKQNSFLGFVLPILKCFTSICEESQCSALGVTSLPLLHIETNITLS